MFRRNNNLGKHYSDGEIVIKQGTVGKCLYVIQQGTVEVIKESGDKEIKITELGKAEFFGEMSLFENDLRSCTVKAKGDATILTLDKRGLYKTIQNDPTLAFRMLEKMSNRLRETDKKLVY